MPVAMQSVTWGDCACTDTRLCVYHTMHLETPKRPSDEEMEKRRLALGAVQRDRFESLRSRIEGYGRLRAALRGLLEEAQDKGTLRDETLELVNAVLNGSSE